MKIISISGVIGWDVTPKEIRDALDEAAGGPVTAEFSSGGGFIGAGLEIANLFRDYSGETTAVLTGYAMSMSSYIPMFFDNVKAHDNAVLMIHNAGGVAWGDHNEILKYGNLLKGFSGMLAKAYVKKTGTPVDEIASMMDEETFFFGEEILEAGFVDEIITTDQETEKEEASAIATQAFEACSTLMRNERAKAQEDMEQAVAFVPQPKQPAAAGTTQEVQQMDLQKLLADNPDAKAEFDKLLADAKAEGMKAGTAEVQARIEKVTPILKSDKYPASVTTVALNVLSGEATTDTLTATVAAVDAVMESNNSDGAADETNDHGDTPAEQAALDAVGAELSTPDQIDAAAKRLKDGGV